MSDYIDPQDKIDALAWLIGIARENEPDDGYSQLDRNRMHVAQLMRDQAQRAARGGSQG
ncbi:hypothetical protein LDO31_02770 [Luteimonas sp. XNQY3]|nr:hypothetical protein [Luteimonas sp. XNQY3]MCD9005169.1 hypothetical protein [Luteimonas sp. XNQY3]